MKATGLTYTAAAAALDTPLKPGHLSISQTMQEDGFGYAEAVAAATWTALVPSLAGDARMRVSHDGGRTYSRRAEQELAADNPGRPVTVPVYGPDGTGRLLAADFDVGRARAAGAEDPMALVAAEAGQLAELIAQLGGRCITDVSPPGGRHVLVRFAEPLPWQELRDVAGALALRFGTLDWATPMAGPGGQICPPGARHKSGGWRVLTMPLDAAVAAVERPCGPQVWAGLLAELARRAGRGRAGRRP
jgi:hypothetical protein